MLSAACTVETVLFSAEGGGHGFFDQPSWYQPALDTMLAFLRGHD